MFQWRIGFIDFGFNTTSLLSHGCVQGKVAYFAFDRFENLWPLRSRTIRNRHQTLKSDFSYRLKASNRSEIIIKYATGLVPTCVKGTPLCSIITKPMKQYMEETNQSDIQPIGHHTITYATGRVPTCVKWTPLCSIITKPMKPIHAGNEPTRTNLVNMNSLWLSSLSITYRR
jgi:hypothetical protein